MNHQTAMIVQQLNLLRRDRALRVALASFLATRLIVVAAMEPGASRLPRLYHNGWFTEIALMWDGAWYARRRAVAAPARRMLYLGEDDPLPQRRA